MESVLATVGPEFAERRHRLIFDLVDSEARFTGDRSTIAQMIEDVLQNARRYSLTQGTFLRVVLENGEVVITVRDSSAETEQGSEVVVRFQVPRSGSVGSWVSVGGRDELNHRVTLPRPLLNERAAP